MGSPHQLILSPRALEAGSPQSGRVLGIRNLILALSVVLVVVCSAVIGTMMWAACGDALDGTESNGRESLRRSEDRARDNVMEVVVRLMDRISDSAAQEYKAYLAVAVLPVKSLREYLSRVPVQDVYDSGWLDDHLRLPTFGAQRQLSPHGLSLFGFTVFGAYCPTLAAEFGCDTAIATADAASNLTGPISSICEKTCKVCMDVPSGECVDDPDGELKKVGVGCTLLLGMGGCDMELSTLSSEAPAGMLARHMCPKSCADCGDGTVCRDDALAVRSLWHGVPSHLSMMYTEDWSPPYVPYAYGNIWGFRDDDLADLGTPDAQGRIRDRGKKCNLTAPKVSNGTVSMGLCDYPHMAHSSHEFPGDTTVCPGCAEWQRRFHEGKLQYEVGRWDPVIDTGNMIQLMFYYGWEHPDQRRSSVSGRGVGGACGAIDVDRFTLLLKRIDLPKGSRIYAVERNPKTAQVGVLVGTSHGTSNLEVAGRETHLAARHNDSMSEVSTVRSMLHAPDSTDPVISAHSSSVLAVQNNYSSFDPNSLHHWAHSSVEYFVKISGVEDNGLLLWLSLLLPVDVVMQTIDEASRETTQWILQKQDETTKERDSQFRTLWLIVAAFVVVLLLATVFLSRAIVKPLIRLAGDMDKVAQMDFGSCDDDREVSRLYEVRDMETSFLLMQTDLRKWRDDEQERRRVLEVEHEQRVQRNVDIAMRDVTNLVHPMVLTQASAFLALGGLTPYERLRDQGKLIFLDTEEKLKEFKEKNVIVFLSHQWLDWGWPDPDNMHYRTMAAAVRHVSGVIPSKSGGELDISELYVWVDFGSIAQEHRGMQSLAVSSLPVYSSAADCFVVVVPETTHNKTGKQCDVDTYGLRGWCRAEMLAKVCGSGLKNMYVCLSVDGELLPFTESWLDRLSLSVFEGEFSCCAVGHKGSGATCDKEALVLPVLGLYCLMLRGRHLSHVKPILRHVQENRHRFFPRSFVFQGCDADVGRKPDGSTNRGEESWEEDHELFGGLVEAMEARIEAESAGRRHRPPGRRRSASPRPAGVDASMATALGTSPPASPPARNPLSRGRGCGDDAAAPDPERARGSEEDSNGCAQILPAEQMAVEDTYS